MEEMRGEMRGTLVPEFRLVLTLHLSVHSLIRHLLNVCYVVNTQESEFWLISIVSLSDESVSKFTEHHCIYKIQADFSYLSLFLKEIDIYKVDSQP